MISILWSMIMQSIIAFQIACKDLCLRKLERGTTLDDEVYKISSLCVRKWTPHQSITRGIVDGSLGALLALLPVSAWEIFHA